MVVADKGARKQGGCRKAHPQLWRFLTDEGGEGETHFVGSSFLLLDALFVDGHHPGVGGGGGIVISVGGVRGVFSGLVLGGGGVGDGGEDGRWEYALKGCEHLDAIRSSRGELWRRSRQER